MGAVRVRPLGDEERAWATDLLVGTWGSTEVARLGELVDAAGLPAFVAVDDGARIGLVTVAERPDGVEVVTIEATRPGTGVGRALMDRVYDHAVSVGAHRMWLVTTNDNVRAFRFYQRWGMSLRDVVIDGVARSRRVKPSIPSVGADGIPLRHELVFERMIGAVDRPLSRSPEDRNR